MARSIPFLLYPEQAWQEASDLMKHWPATLPRQWLEILMWKGSLTRFLENRWQCPVEVRVENQVTSSEWQAEGFFWQGYPVPSSSKQILLRNAWLHVAGRDRVFAHSQLDTSGLPCKMRDNIQNGVRPLGSLFLEQSADVRRTCLQLASIRSAELAMLTGQTPDSLFWCRRSLFQAGHAQARIVEIFLAPLTSEIYG